MRPTQSKRILLPIAEITVVVALFGVFIWIAPDPVTGSSMIPVIAIFVILLMVKYGVIHGFRRRARSDWDELTDTLPLQPADFELPPRRPWNLFSRSLLLTPFEGTHSGHRVRVEANHDAYANHLPYFTYNLFFGNRIYKTTLSLERMESDGVFDMKVEKRRRLEKTDTRIESAGDLGERTPFEMEHHLFTNAPETARALLGPTIQQAVEGLENFDSLRIKDDRLEITLEGITADPETITNGLDLLAELARQIPREPGPTKTIDEFTASAETGPTARPQGHSIP